MDYYTIIAQRTILDKELTGKVIESIRLKDFTTLFLGFEGEKALKLACIPDMPYLITIPKRFIPQKNTQDWHFSKFAGKKLTGITRTPGDRILTFISESGFRLVFEMTGRNANIIVVDSGSIVVGSTRQVTRRESGFRTIFPGIAYQPPPSRSIPELIADSLPKLKNMIETSDGAISDVIPSITGGSKIFAGEVLSLTGIPKNAQALTLSSGEIEKLLATAVRLAEIIEQGGEGGTVIMDSRTGIPRDVFPLPITSTGEKNRYFDDLNEAVKTYAKDREIALELRSVLQSILSALSREEKNIFGTIQKIEHERGGKNEAEDIDRRANALLTGLGRIKRGMRSIRLTDPYTGEEIEVELDPAQEGHTQAERLFTRARKLRSAALMAEKRLKLLAKRLEEIRIERESLDTMEDIHELKKKASLYARKISSSQKPEEAEKFPRRFTTDSGREILVGRNDTENDELVRWAGRNDIWLHAQGVGGSHVILRSPGKQMPDHRSIEQAAAIAAYYSKAKTSAFVPVVWTLVKYVIKRKGQGPGKVTYTREKVIFTEPARPVGE
jgi:predicted ribosome quality control (RQC) complex YloA/Tae2 family protein